MASSQRSAVRTLQQLDQAVAAFDAASEKCEAVWRVEDEIVLPQKGMHAHLGGEGRARASKQRKTAFKRLEEVYEAAMRHKPELKKLSRTPRPWRCSRDSRRPRASWPASRSNIIHTRCP